MSILDLPATNAVLNSVATVLLVAGWICIRRRNVRAHMLCMISALAVSVAFLACYLTWHAYLVRLTGRGHVPFTHHGPVRYLYFAILFTHLIGSFSIIVLVPITVYRAAKRRFDRHKAIARWTLPVWLYVSITGVIVYAMNYRWFPSAEWESIKVLSAGSGRHEPRQS